jgi:hypothetical protein
MWACELERDTPTGALSGNKTKGHPFDAFRSFEKRHPISRARDGLIARISIDVAVFHHLVKWWTLFSVQVQHIWNNIKHVYV